MEEEQNRGVIRPVVFPDITSFDFSDEYSVLTNDEAQFLQNSIKKLYLEIIELKKSLRSVSEKFI